jgi:hypothetical protein
MNSSRRRTECRHILQACLLGCILAVGSPMALAAQLTAAACVVADSPLGPFTCDYEGPAPGGLLTVTSSDGQSSAVGNVGFGFFSGTVASAISVTAPLPDSEYGLATVDVEWRDTLGVVAPALTGTFGTMTFAINVAASSSVSENQFGNISPDYCSTNCGFAQTTWSLDVTAGAFNQIQPIRAGGDDSDTGLYGDSPGLFLYTVPIVFGTDHDLWVRFIANAGAGGAFVPGPATVTASAALGFANTIEWQGITEVRDAEGALVTAFSTTSGSGVDYSQPIAAVPLPGAAWLLATALAGLAGRHVRRRQA